MRKRKIASLVSSLLIMFLCMPFATPIHAAENRLDIESIPIISPQYIYINRASCSLDITNGTATIKGTVQKTPTGENIYLLCTLQKYYDESWHDVKNWSDSSSTSPSVHISKSYTVGKGKYRVEAYYSVSGPGGSDSDTIYSKTVTY